MHVYHFMHQNIPNIRTCLCGLLFYHAKSSLMFIFFLFKDMLTHSLPPRSTSDAVTRREKRSTANTTEDHKRSTDPKVSQSSASPCSTCSENGQAVPWGKWGEGDGPCGWVGGPMSDVWCVCSKELNVWRTLPHSLSCSLSLPFLPHFPHAASILAAEA